MDSGGMLWKSGDFPAGSAAGVGGRRYWGLGAMLVGDRIDIMMMARGEGKAQRFEQSGVMDEPFYKFRVWNCKSCKGEWE